jgi:hypothetical protein
VRSRKVKKQRRGEWRITEYVGNATNPTRMTAEKDKERQKVKKKT